MSEVFSNLNEEVNVARGVTWYTATWFAFDAVAAFIHQYLSFPVQVGKDVRGSPRAVYDTVRYGWILTATASFFVHLDYPVGRSYAPLGVQPAYVVQYISAYTLGQLSLEHGDARMTEPIEQATSTGSDGSGPPMSGNTTVKPIISLPMAVVISVSTAPFYIFWGVWEAHHGAAAVTSTQQSMQSGMSVPLCLLGRP